VRDTSGEHCLFSVAVAIDPKPITLLISKGADPLIRNNQRRTVLHQVLQDFRDYEPDIAKVIAMFRTLRALLLHVPSLLSASNDTALPADRCDCPCSEEGCLPTVTLMPVFRHQLLTLPRNVMWTLECLAVFRDLDRPDWVRQSILSWLRHFKMDELEMPHRCECAAKAGHAKEERFWDVIAEERKIETLEAEMVELRSASDDQLEKKLLLEMRRSFELLLARREDGARKKESGKRRREERDRGKAAKNENKVSITPAT